MKITKLKLLRLHNELTQLEVANYLGIARSQLSFYENELQPMPGCIKEKLTTLYKCKVSDLI